MTRIIKLMILNLVFLAGCSSHIPERIREPLENELSLHAVLNGESTPPVKVRWGGVISQLSTQAGYTQVTISSRDLNSYGEPRNNDQSEGRFEARFKGELDDTLFRQGRMLTVYGSLLELRADQARPVVAVDSHYLWPEYRYVRRYYDPFYEPFYDPYWPYPFPARQGLLLPYAPHRHGYYPLRYRYPPFYGGYYRYPGW